MELSNAIYGRRSIRKYNEKLVPKNIIKKIIDAGFFDFMEKELTRIIGPVASVILDEEIKNMGEERGVFPVGKVSLLVEKVSGEIADDTQRIAFQKTTLDALKGY